MKPIISDTDYSFYLQQLSTLLLMFTVCFLSVTMVHHSRQLAPLKFFCHHWFTEDTSRLFWSAAFLFSSTMRLIRGLSVRKRQHHCSRASLALKLLGWAVKNGSPMIFLTPPPSSRPAPGSAAAVRWPACRWNCIKNETCKCRFVSNSHQRPLWGEIEPGKDRTGKLHMYKDVHLHPKIYNLLKQNPVKLLKV